jgi:hypothetical protein
MPRRPALSLHRKPESSPRSFSGGGDNAQQCSRQPAQWENPHWTLPYAFMAAKSGRGGSVAGRSDTVVGVIDRTYDEGKDGFQIGPVSNVLGGGSEDSILLW